MVIAGSDRTTRRRGGRRASAPVDVGQTLRDARQGLGLTLPEIHDRTGVPWRYLEALEASDLGIFPDERTAQVSVRRYADILQLDSAKLGQVVHDRWASTVTGLAPATAVAPTAIGWTESAAGTTGHLRRYPGDDEHLRAFTRTAPVPQVRGPASGVGLLSTVSSGTATTPAPLGPSHTGHLRRAPTPRPLKLALWVTAAALVVVGAGLVVHHYRPQWLADLHVVRGTTPATTAPTTPALPPPATVVAAPADGGRTTNVLVRSGNYRVVVIARAPCWVQAFDPGNPHPVFSGVLAPGQSQSFVPAAGRLAVQFGASGVTVHVLTGLSAAPTWTFEPSVAPFQMNFATGI